MDLYHSIRQIVMRLDAAKLRYAVIGGMAMALRGVQRATFDLDFLLMLEDRDVAWRILSDEGFTCVFSSENVSHFVNPGHGLARVDILHAFRGPSLSMLNRTERLPLGEDCLLPVLQVEDLIGLKVQAAINDPGRALGDWNDIYRLVIQAASDRRVLDWERVDSYLMIFGCEEKREELKSLYERYL